MHIGLWPCGQLWKIRKCGGNVVTSNITNFFVSLDCDIPVHRTPNTRRITLEYFRSINSSDRRKIYNTLPK